MKRNYTITAALLLLVLRCLPSAAGEPSDSTVVLPWHTVADYWSTAAHVTPVSLKDAEKSPVYDLRNKLTGIIPGVEIKEINGDIMPSGNMGSANINANSIQLNSHAFGSMVLIVDDVRAGFRMDIAGSDHYFGFEADLICFCKALANGYNVSAICGKQHLMNAMSSLAFTGSYWMSAVPFAAGIACIEKMKRLNCPQLLIDQGTKLKDGLIETAKKYDYDLHVTGIPSLFYLRIADDPTLMLHQEWIAEVVKRGVFFTNHHNHFINASLTDEDIKETLEIADEAFAVVKDRHS